MEITKDVIRKRVWWVILTVLGVLILDQTFKFWVKTHMNIGDEFNILGFQWARIHFVENPGMAFGLEFGGSVGKLALGIFRIIAVGFLIYILRWLIGHHPRFGLVFCFSLILACAIGNILDSAFYGLLFSESSYHGGVAEFLPAEGGYAPFFYGRVVDMLYFPMYRSIWPDWVPLIGGNRLEFFRPVFNLADASISIGVISILLFHREVFKSKPQVSAAEMTGTIIAEDPDGASEEE